MIIVKIIGGLGNQLFQYSIGRALSILHNTDMKLDLSFFEEPKYSIVYRLDKFNLPFTIANESDYIHLKNKTDISKMYRVLKRLGFKIEPYYKKTHIIENQVLSLYKTQNKTKKDYYIEGWLANPSYFKAYREIILKDLNADNLLSKENLILQHEVKNTNSVAVHIRRKDYLTNTYFKSLPKEYYQKSMKRAMDEIKNPIFYFFSDDIAWAKEQFSDIQNVRFIENNSIADSMWSTVCDIADLMLMRSCKNQIIANSTFSWWGAWLNENPAKQVYFPALWYNDIKAQKQFENNIFIPSNWIKVQF